jgi:ZIP family zinc transporter
VILLGTRAAALRPLLWGVTIGVMAVAAIAGLLVPAAHDGSPRSVATGAAARIVFIALAQRRIQSRDVHWGKLEGAGVRRSALVFGVLFVHSLPEGLAIGAAYASDDAGLGLFVIVAIALQNVPEGTSVAIPMAASGFSGSQQFWAAVLTSAPQPVGAVVAYFLVREVESVLPLSLAFAGGAMLTLVVAELMPQAFARGQRVAAAGGTAVGAAVMLALSLALRV